MTIILTKTAEEGNKLKKSLSIYSNCNNLNCYTKDDIIKNPNNFIGCKYIFSSWYMPCFTEDEISKYLPSLSAIFYAAGTVGYFAEPFLKKNIRIFTAAEANAIPVAEFAMSTIILAGKGYFQANRTYKWSIFHRLFFKARKFSESKYGNYGAKIGVLGCGSIGSKVVELLKPFQNEILVYDPFVSEKRIKQLGGRKADIKDIFKECDVISNHLPDIPETKKLINFDLLSTMKANATIINTGRGAQIDEKALFKIMKNNKYMSAVLDVTSHEPLYPWSPLFWCKNIFLTPHIAGSLSHEYDRMVKYAVSAYEDILSGQESPYETSLNVISKQSAR